MDKQDPHIFMRDVDFDQMSIVEVDLKGPSLCMSMLLSYRLPSAGPYKFAMRPLGATTD